MYMKNSLGDFDAFKPWKMYWMASSAKTAEPVNSPTVIFIEQPHRRQQNCCFSCLHCNLLPLCHFSRKNVGKKWKRTTYYPRNNAQNITHYAFWIYLPICCRYVLLTWRTIFCYNRAFKVKVILFGTFLYFLSLRWLIIPLNKMSNLLLHRQ